jgi:hypothetical protein
MARQVGSPVGFGRCEDVVLLTHELFDQVVEVRVCAQVDAVVQLIPLEVIAAGMVDGDHVHGALQVLSWLQDHDAVVCIEDDVVVAVGLADVPNQVQVEHLRAGIRMDISGEVLDVVEVLASDG